MKHHQKFVQMSQAYNSTFGFPLEAGYTLELGIKMVLFNVILKHNEFINYEIERDKGNNYDF